MNLDLKRRAFTLLRETLDQPLETQTDWLAQHCGNDKELQTEVLKLLATQHGAPILDRPALALATTLAPPDDDNLDELPIDTAIGAWRVQRTLGRGGMGAVFLVERSGADFVQHGALKLIRRGMDSSDILLRFRRERQILARLQHANIARLLDGGLSATGQPYLVMEYVEGQLLMAWAEQKQADLTQRLDLLRKLCDAVAYAHRQLIVHRDIKPGNVLVDANGEPKLLDFGVAKVLEDTEQDEQTTAASRFLTRAYAAPEQIRGEAVSTATDIHALGVLLFELLSGARFHGNAYATTGRPALRLMQARLQVGANGPAAITPKSLRGDLGIIVARACDDEPARRYATVEAFADDIRRWQDKHPIEARADSTSYRLSRFVRRHAIASFAGVLASSAIIAGGSIALWQAHRAENEAALAQASQRFLTSVFDASAPDRAAGARITARDLLDQGAARAQTELADQPRLQASMLQTLGILYRQLGQFEHAATLLIQARTLAASSGQSDAAEQARGVLELAIVQRETGKYDEAQTLLDEALKLSRDDAQKSAVYAERALLDEKQGKLKQALEDTRIAAALDAARGPQGAADSARDRHLQALMLSRLGDYDGASAAFIDAIARATAALGSEHSSVAQMHNDYATQLIAQMRSKEAEVEVRLALEARQKRLGENHPAIAEALQLLGGTLRQQGRLDEAETALDHALEIQRQALGAQHPDTANTLNSLGLLAMSQQHFVVAEARLGESFAIFRTNHLETTPAAITISNNWGVVLMRLGRYDQAEPLMRNALEKHRAQVGDEHPLVMSDLNALSQLARRRGNTAEAVEHARKALIIAEAKLGKSRDSESIRNTLASALLANGQASAAQATYQQALDALHALNADTDPRYAQALFGLAKTYLALGKTDQAQRLAQQVLQLRRDHFASDNGGLAATQALLARIAYARGNRAAAQAAHAEAQTLLAAWQEPDPEVAQEIKTALR